MAIVQHKGVTYAIWTEAAPKAGSSASNESTDNFIEIMEQLKEQLRLRKSMAARSTLRRKIDEMIGRATEVLGTRDEALRWLGTPIPALDFATPISVLGTKKGAARVKDVLTQMEHGVW